MRMWLLKITLQAIQDLHFLFYIQNLNGKTDAEDFKTTLLFTGLASSHPLGFPLKTTSLHKAPPDYLATWASIAGWNATSVSVKWLEHHRPQIQFRKICIQTRHYQIPSALPRSSDSPHWQTCFNPWKSPRELNLGCRAGWRCMS